MSTKSQIAYGIALSNSSTSGGSYTAVAELLAITPPVPSVDEVKVYRSDAATVNGSPVVERIPGWTEVEDAEFEITYQPAQRAILEGLVAVPSFWKVAWPKVAGQTVNGDVDQFAGFLKTLGKETPIKDSMKCKCKIAISGAVNYTQGS